MPATTRRARANAALLTDILPLLGECGFLQVVELGRMAQVSSTLNKAVTNENEHVWANICRQEFPNTVAVQDVVEKMGYKWLYQRWSAPLRKKRLVDEEPSELSAPSCSLEQVQFCIHLELDGIAIHDEVFSGVQFAPLLVQGSGVKISLPRPIVLGTAEWNVTPEELMHYEGDDGIGLPIKLPEKLQERLAVLVHMHRKTDSSLVALYSSCDCTMEHYGQLLYAHPLIDKTQKKQQVNYKVDWSKSARKDKDKDDNETCLLHFFNYEHHTNAKWPPLRDTPEARAIFAKFPYPTALGMGLELGLVPVVGKQTKVAISSVTLEAWKYVCAEQQWQEFDSSQLRDNNGVTMWHILSELRGE